MNENTWKKKERRRSSQSSVYSIGMPLLFVTFIAVCLIILTAVAVITAKNDMRESRDHAARRTAYQRTMNQAEERTAALADGISSQTEFTIDMKTGGKIDFRISGTGADARLAAWKIRSVEKWSGGDQTVSGIKLQ